MLCRYTNLLFFFRFALVKWCLTQCFDLLNRTYLVLPFFSLNIHQQRNSIKILWSKKNNCQFFSKLKVLLINKFEFPLINQYVIHYVFPCYIYTPWSWSHENWIDKPAWKVSKYGVISGSEKSYLSVFSPNAGKYGPEITPSLDNFHTVKELFIWWKKYLTEIIFSRQFSVAFSKPYKVDYKNT